MRLVLTIVVPVWAPVWSGLFSKAAGYLFKEQEAEKNQTQEPSCVPIANFLALETRVTKLKNSLANCRGR